MLGLRWVVRLVFAFGVLALISCERCECREGAPNGSAIERALRAGDDDAVRSALDREGAANEPTTLRVDVRELVKGEPKKWLGSYLKRNQLLLVLALPIDPTMCPGGTPPRQVKSVGEAGDRIWELTKQAGAHVRKAFSDVRPLHVAAFFCRPAAAQLLLEHGADVEATDGMGLTPLHWSSCGDVTEVLLKAGAKVGAVDSRGLTPLHLAIDGRTVDLLIEHGADANARDACGNTPLHMAARVGLKFERTEAAPSALPPDAPAWLRALLRVVSASAEILLRLFEHHNVYDALVTGGADATLENAVGHSATKVRELSASRGGGDWD